MTKVFWLPTIRWLGSPSPPVRLPQRTSRVRIFAWQSMACSSTGSAGGPAGVTPGGPPGAAGWSRSAHAESTSAAPAAAIQREQCWTSLMTQPWLVVPLRCARNRSRWAPAFHGSGDDAGPRMVHRAAGAPIPGERRNRGVAVVSWRLCRRDGPAGRFGWSRARMPGRLRGSVGAEAAPSAQKQVLPLPPVPQSPGISAPVCSVSLFRWGRSSTQGAVQARLLRGGEGGAVVGLLGMGDPRDGDAAWKGSGLERRSASVCTGTVAADGSGVEPRCSGTGHAGLRRAGAGGMAHGSASAFRAGKMPVNVWSRTAPKAGNSR